VNSIDWPIVPQFPELNQGQVQLWLAHLDMGPAVITSLFAILSENERARAERFYGREAEGRFIAAHGLLRVILSRYLKTDPQVLSFGYGAHDKPYLEKERTSGLHFNYSRSQGLAIYALGLGREVGVDIEQIRTDRAAGEIAGHFFPTRETAALKKLDEAERTEAFFRSWTVKEAYLKATGEGLAGSIRLQELLVQFDEGRVELLRTSESGFQEVEGWEVTSFRPMPGYMAAVAIAGQGGTLIPSAVSFSHAGL
jgi:4'-phosphopantetheinyl transferase